MRATRTLVAVAGAAVLGLSTVVASAATATAAHPEALTEPYEVPTFECGYPIDVAGEFTYSVAIRTHSPQRTGCLLLARALLVPRGVDQPRHRCLVRHPRLIGWRSI